MKHIRRAFILAHTVLLIVACSIQPTEQDLSPEEIAETMIAEIAIAKQTQEAPSPMPEASPTPEPVKITLPLAPTSNPVPIRVSDDFSTRRDIWGQCEFCEWEDGALRFGPYPPRGVGPDQVFWVICTACGKHRFYRVAADVTYSEGYGADRTFGLLSGLSQGKYLGGGTITTTQAALYETFDFVSNEWGVETFDRFRAVNPGSQTNHIEVTLREGSIEGRADINVIVNGEVLVSHYNQEVDPTEVGLYLGWHSIAVTYDNFEFESFEQETDSQTLWVDPGSVAADPFPQGLLANSPRFSEPEGISVGGSSSAIATGDFNEDEFTDLAVAVDSSVQSHVLLANGDGSFQSVMRGIDVLKAADVQSADFNGDGHQDLAFLSESAHEIRIVLGDGRGGFIKPIIGKTNPQPRSLATADFNVDGRPDLAISNAGSNDVTIFLGKGTGSFVRGVSVRVGMEPSSIDQADFNRDGNPDLAVVNLSTGDVSVLLGDGSGEFSPPDFYFIDFASSLIAADVNHDGKPDIVFANPGKSMISIMLGNGMGGFYVPIHLPTEQPPDSLVVVDLNQDGTLDLATANMDSHAVSVYLGDRSGNFGLAQTIDLNTYPVSLAAGDFNQDGLVDLAVANFSGLISKELAQGKHVICSNSQVENRCERAVDGIHGSNWISNQRPPGWIEVDLGATYAINKLILDHSGDALTRRFVHYIEVKGPDLSDHYRKLYTIDDTTTGGKEYTFKPEEPILDVRYIRIRTTNISGGNLRPAWSEIKVYGSRRAPLAFDQDVESRQVLILFQTGGG